MLAVTIASAIWSGYEVITIIVKNRLDYLTRLMGGIPLGILYQSLLVFILQLYIPWSLKLNLLINVISLTIAISCHLISNKLFRPSYTIKMTILDLCTLSISTLWVLYRLQVVLMTDGITAGCCFSDYSFHYNIISSCAIGLNQKRKSLFDLTFPISVADKLVYPMLPNFYASFLIATTNSGFLESFRYPTFFVAISWVFLLHKLALTFTGSSLASALALPLWAFSGGIGWLQAIDDGLVNYYSDVNYIHQWKNLKNVFWFQSMTHIFNPQRSATFVLPLCALTMICLIKGVKKYDISYFVLAALPVGIMPQTQVHAYVSMAIFSISLCLITYDENIKKKWFKAWFVFAVLANVIAIPLGLPYLGRTKNNSNFFNFSPVWKDEHYHSKGPLGIYWKSLGVTGLIALVFGFATADPFQLKIYFSCLVEWLIASTIMFQPWELDNTKLLHDCWFPIAVAFVGQYFEFLFTQFKNKPFIIIIAAILYVSAMMSGIFNIKITEWYKIGLFIDDLKDAGLWAAENMPVTSVTHFYNHVCCPISLFGGRPLFHGYMGWTQSHGVINTTKLRMFSELDQPTNPSIYINNNITYYLMNNDSKTIHEANFIEPVMECGEFKLLRILPVQPKQENLLPKLSSDPKNNTMTPKTRKRRFTTRSRKITPTPIPK